MRRMVNQELAKMQSMTPEVPPGQPVFQTRRRRIVWAVGLAFYLFGLFMLMLTPFFVPFLGAVVILACVSVSGEGVRDNRAVMGSAIMEIAIGAFFFSILDGRPDWMEPIVAAAFYIGCLLPIAVTIYNIARGRPQTAA